MRLRLATWLFCALVASPCLALEATDYGYPFVDPLEATVIGTPEAFQAKLPEDIPIEVREFLPLAGRQTPEIFWWARLFSYSFSPQPGRAPLAFIIPGTGAGHSSSKSVDLQRMLYAAGLHVVSLPSPIHPNFIISASASGRPGLLSADAVDLHQVMTMIRRQLTREIDISGYDLVGYSLGATQAAFVAWVDDQQQSFDFDRVLLINPPVDLLRSASVLDRLYSEHIHSLADFDHLFNQLIQLFSEFYQPTEHFVLDEELIYELYRRRPPPDSTLEALIGIAFRLSSTNLLFTADVMDHLGVLVAADRRLGVTDSLTPYFKAGSLLDFEYYARRVLYPHYLETRPGVSFQEFAHRDSLRVLDDFLRRADNIGLMHNKDDILIDEEELNFLEDVFGSRAQIYPKGGHVGNLLYRDNVAYVINFFRD